MTAVSKVYGTRNDFVLEPAPMHEPNPSIQVQVRVRDSLLSAIESFRRNEPDLPTRPEAVRRLIRRAIATAVENGGGINDSR